MQRHLQPNPKTPRGFLRIAGCLGLCLLGLCAVRARADDAEPAGAGDAKNGAALNSFQDFVAAVRRGERVAPPAEKTADANDPGYLSWTRYTLAQMPAGCETECSLRKTLGEPESTRAMAGWKMLDYPAVGLVFLVSPLGNATAAAHVVEDGSNGFNETASEDAGAPDLFAPTVGMMERLAGYVGGWTGLSYERPDDASARDNGKAQARENGATNRDMNARSAPRIFTPKEYDVRDRTLRLIRAAM